MTRSASPARRTEPVTTWLTPSSFAMAGVLLVVPFSAKAELREITRKVVVALPVSVERFPSWIVRTALRLVVILPFFVFIRHVAFSLTRPYMREYLHGEQAEAQMDA